jgi:hypothetical protein
MYETRTSGTEFAKDMAAYTSKPRAASNFRLK